MERPGYQELTVAHEGRQWVVLRARKDGRRVVMKVPKLDPQGHSGALLKRQYEALRGLNVPGIVKVVALEENAHGPALVFEDAGMHNLEEKLRTHPFSVESFFDVAVPITRVLQSLHSRDIIHRDVSPSNVVFNGETPVLVDFDLATSVAGLAEKHELPLELVDSLPYVAPEQTGRTDQVVDHRSDLYSLGALFYHVLTGAPPFRASDPVELIHAHLAATPLSPSQVDPAIPAALSNVILKLLSKAPEDRYQSAEALATDLDELKRQWATARSMERFELGRLDLARILPLSGGLYGREAEQSRLFSALERAIGGARELFLLSGVPGIGKTALVDSLHSKLGRASVISGKCDQLRTGVPYSAIVGAVRSHIQDLFKGSPETAATWRRQLVHALGTNSALFRDLIPELSSLVDEQSPTSYRDPVETENRFHRTFRSLVKVLAGPEHPLVLFLDDLQWADSASLKLLRSLALDEELTHLLFVGAFRSVDSEHPMAREIRALKNAGGAINEIVLGPLSLTQVAELIRDALSCEPTKAGPLAKLIMRKTVGNPFFVRRLLRYLQQSKMLVFDTAARLWNWNIDEIEAVGIAENVVDLLVETFDQLPPDTPPLLKVAACVGHQADLNLIAAVHGSSTEEAGRHLWPAIQEGLLLPIKPRRFNEMSNTPNACYAFAHDRVQQAVYSLLPKEEKRALHLGIGQRLLGTLLDSEFEERIFEVVDQLNLGAALLKKTDEELKLAQLNERAGRKAKSTAAFDPAFRYFKAALDLLGPSGWKKDPALTFRVHRDGAECAFLIGQQAVGDELIDTALSHVIQRAHRAELYRVRVMECGKRAVFSDAIHWGREGLRVLGLDLPEADLLSAGDAKDRAVQTELRGRSLEDVLALPEVQNEEMAIAKQILAQLIPPAWYLNKDLLRWLGSEMVLLSLRHGHDVTSATGFVAYAYFLAGNGQYAEAYNYGRLAIALARRFGNPSEECQADFIFGTFMVPWREPLRNGVSVLRKGLALAMESGNLQWGSYLRATISMLQHLIGIELDRELTELDATLDFMRSRGVMGDFYHVLVHRQAVRCLRGRTRERSSLEDDEFNQATFLKEAAVFPTATALYYILQLQIASLMGDLDAAVAASRAVRDAVSVWQAHPVAIHYVFYSGWALAATGNLEEARVFERQLADWSAGTPSNFLHKHLLVLAELARADGRVSEALSFYERAINAAAQEGFVADEALAQERCGRLLQSMEVHKGAVEYLSAARDRFSRWGATAKVRQLEEEFPNIAAAASFPAVPRGETAIDFLGLLKALEGISSQLALSGLLERLLEVCLQVAGAQRGALILNEEQGLMVEALASASEPVSLERVPLAESEALPRSVIEHVQQTGEWVVLSDAAHAGAFASDPFIAGRRIRSILAMPIVRLGRKLGVLYLDHSLGAHAFLPERIRVLQMLSSQIAISLENSVLFQKLTVEVKDRTRAEEAMRFLAEASRTLAESIDYSTTLTKVARLALPSFADWCVVDVFDEQGNIRRLAAANADPRKEKLLQEMEEQYPLDPRSPQPAGRVLRSGEILLLTNVSDAMVRDYSLDERHAQILRQLGVRSLIAVPMSARGRTLGAITLVYSAPERHYGPQDIALAQELARRAALAIDNAGLYRDAQKAIQLRDDFLQVASHELRTPLTSLHLSMEMLLRGTAEPHRVVQVAERQTRRLSRQVEALLNVSRIQSEPLLLNREVVDLSGLVREVSEEFRAGSGRLAPLVVHASEPVVGRWDATQLEQVTTNLLDNAIKFGESKPVEVTVERAGRLARLVVSDHGIGIPIQQQDHVFERFHRGVSISNYGGLGLGLYIVKEIISAHGGTVAVQSAPHQGATFTVELPV